MRTVVYDTGALLAAERRQSGFLALHDELVAAHVQPIVPVVVLAQAWRGGPQHQLSRLLKACTIVPDTEQVGRVAGAACGVARTSDVVDAIVVTLAIRNQAPVVTSDPDDLTHLADSLGVKLLLYPV